MALDIRNRSIMSFSRPARASVGQVGRNTRRRVSAVVGHDVLLSVGLQQQEAERKEVLGRIHNILKTKDLHVLKGVEASLLGEKA